jgi:hypothetical protein
LPKGGKAADRKANTGAVFSSVSKAGPPCRAPE